MQTKIVDGNEAVASVAYRYRRVSSHLLVGLLRVAKRRAERAAAERAGEATAEQEE